MALTSRQLKALLAASSATTGNRIAAALDLAGMTQMALAEAIGEAQPYISDVARGRYQTITVAKARKFAEFFGCSIEDLFPAREAIAS